jgi:undecaprenyl-diphosphatase
MSTLHALIIAILQGATELFPVSSLGHAVIVPSLLGWHLDQHAPAFLPFLVMLHLGTAAALLLYFWRDWGALAAGVIGAAPPHQTRESRHILLLIIVATIPAVIVAVLFEHLVRTLFASPLYAAGFLTLNGFLLLFGERLRGTAPNTPTPIATLTLLDALIIGIWQCTALLPGISRSGATITGGLLRGKTHASAARFSFLIAPPIIIAASVKQVPSLLHAGIASGVFEQAALAALVAGIVAFLSTAFLMRYFARHDDWALNPFAYYCIAAGLISAVLLYAGITLPL